MRRICFALTAATLLLIPARTGAQVIRGELVEDASAKPIDAAFVQLIDETDTRLGGALTDSAGRFILRAPAAGRYRLRAERIGYRSVTSVPIAVPDSGAVSFRLGIPVEALRLAGLTAQGKRRCELHPDEGERTALLWEEARKALAVTSWTHKQQFFQFDVSHFDRELDLGLKLRREKRNMSSGLWERPFTAIAAESLAVNGFIQDTRDGLIYYGPDADVLLSDIFLDTHCLQFVPPDRSHAGLVGLGFRPARETQQRSDIRGILWMDSLTAELRSIEFNYTNVPVMAPAENAGGIVEFRRLDSGAWIVNRWSIRVPQIMTIPTPVAFGRGRRRTVLGTFQVPRLSGYRETGGEVLGVGALADALRMQAPAARGAALFGTVYDSTRAAPLTNAVVYLSGTSHATRTNEKGEFSFTNIGEGDFFVAVAHPALDSMLYTVPVRAVRVIKSQPLDVSLAVPPLSALRARYCPGAQDSSSVLLQGVVREPQSGAPLGGARVQAAWGRNGTATVAADESGHYRMCGPPVETPFTVRAAMGKTTGTAVNHTATTRIARVDLTIP